MNWWQPILIMFAQAAIILGTILVCSWMFKPSATSSVYIDNLGVIECRQELTSSGGVSICYPPPPDPGGKQ